MPTEAGDLVSLLVEAEDGLLVDVVRGRDYHRLEPVQLKLDSQRLASIQFTVQQARVPAPEKIWEPSDMSSLHYFLH